MQLGNILGPQLPTILQNQVSTARIGEIQNHLLNVSLKFTFMYLLNNLS